MAFRLYIGNYPSEFTKEDVQNLFQDFDGVKIEKILYSTVNGKSKSYSFATCRDIDQLVSVIKTMNGKLVSGRTLIIRASDDSLQEYVSLILQNDESTIPETIFIPIQVIRKKHRHLYGRDESVKSENIFPKSENKAGVSENNSEKYYRHVNEKSEYDNFKTSSNNSSRCSQDSHDKFEQNLAYSSRKGDFVKSDMHKKVHTNSVKSENVFPKSIKNVESIENEYQKYDQRENAKSDYGQFKTNSNSFSRYSEDNWDEEISMYSSSSSGKEDFVKSAMHTTSNVNSMQSEIVSPKSEYSTRVMENNSPNYCYQKSVKRDYNQFEASSRNSSKYSENSQEIYEKNPGHSSCFVHQYKASISDIDNEGSKGKNSGYWHHYRDTSAYHETWVSVSNFRLGTNIETFYELFSDYNPLRVKIICNKPRRDKTLTEAHICFPNQNIADDVILNFDNTVFEGRVILVTDVDDSTIMDELLDLSNS